MIELYKDSTEQAIARVVVAAASAESTAAVSAACEVGEPASPLVGVGSRAVLSSHLGPHPPSPASECVPFPKPKGKGIHSLAGEGVGGGGSQFGRLEKKPSTMSTLWGRKTTPTYASWAENTITTEHT